MGGKAKEISQSRKGDRYLRPLRKVSIILYSAPLWEPINYTLTLSIEIGYIKSFRTSSLVNNLKGAEEKAEIDLINYVTFLSLLLTQPHQLNSTRAEYIR